MKQVTLEKQTNMEVEVGSIVQNYYGAMWFGMVVDIQERWERDSRGKQYFHRVATIRTICTADGRPHRKSYVKRRDVRWLVVSILPDRYYQLSTS